MDALRRPFLLTVSASGPLTARGAKINSATNSAAATTTIAMDTASAPTLANARTHADS